MLIKLVALKEQQVSFGKDESAAVIATALSPHTSEATYSRKAESTPPENAIATPLREAKYCFNSLSLSISVSNKERVNSDCVSSEIHSQNTYSIIL